jgi:hypothetical protein
MASAGVPLLLFCRKRVDKGRFVDETALTTRSDLLRRFVLVIASDSEAIQL